MPPSLLERWGIPQVSLYVGWDGDLRPERDYEDLDAFYARLHDSATLPVTSQPSVGDFLAVFEPLAEAGRDIVSVHIASGLSGTCDSGREAARVVAARHGVRAEIVDGQTGAGGLGCLVVAAARAAERGEGVDAILEAIDRTREGLDIWFCLDTLEYLRRGGRIGAAQALLGSALQIKPILTFGTEIAPVGRGRTRRRAVDRVVAHLAGRGAPRARGAADWVVQHAQAHEDADRLVAQGREILGAEPLFCMQVGPVLGAHLGSGLLVGGVAAAR